MRTSKTFYTSFQCICAPLLDTEGLVSAGVADATPATASPFHRLSLRTSPSRPALRMQEKLWSVKSHVLLGLKACKTHL